MLAIPLPLGCIRASLSSLAKQSKKLQLFDSKATRNLKHLKHKFDFHLLWAWHNTLFFNHSLEGKPTIFRSYQYQIIWWDFFLALLVNLDQIIKSIIIWIYLSLPILVLFNTILSFLWILNNVINQSIKSINLNLAINISKRSLIYVSTSSSTSSSTSIFEPMQWVHYLKEGKNVDT